MEIKVPNLGDGVDSAIVISILVKPGDSVTKDQTLCELETDKAVAPLPSPKSGTITAITIAEGDTVTMGTSIGSMDVQGAAPAPAPEPSPAAAAPAPTPTPTPVATSAPSAPVAIPAAGPGLNPSPVTSPSLQKIATRIGLDLTHIMGSGSGGRITESDVINYISSVQAHSQQAPQTAAPATTQAAQKINTPLPDFSKWGDVTVEKLSSLRKKIAQKMQESWQTVPHVTQNLDVDITDLMALRKKANVSYQEKNAKLTMTVFAIMAVQKALEKFPQFNASYDADKNELIRKNYYHIGIAVDTENGLIVPVIKDVDKKSPLELCLDLNVIAKKAKNRTLGIEDLQGSTFTISNLGGLGAGTFTPIVNTPEVAILGISAGELRPVAGPDKKLLRRLIMPLSLSYDHRVIDGADGARFISELKTQFESIDHSQLKEN